jgi:hypothetical protein
LLPRNEATLEKVEMEKLEARADLIFYRALTFFGNYSQHVSTGDKLLKGMHQVHKIPSYILRCSCTSQQAAQLPASFGHRLPYIRIKPPPT